MLKRRAFAQSFAAASLALMAFAGAASADGEPGTYYEAPPPVEEGRKLNITFTLGIVSDYVFRGVSQSDREPTIQPSIDLTYGIFYAGVWGSGLDFGEDEFLEPFVFGEDAQVEIDVYAGVTPAWGPVNFDFGVLGYLYPGAADSAAELDYLEIKAAYSTSGLLIPNLTSGTAFYYTPDYSGELGDALSVESTLSYELPKMGVVTPTISGLYGTLYGDDAAFEAQFGDDEYSFWNAGVSFAVEKFTFDFRYWDTDLDTIAGLPCNGGIAGNVFSCDEQFVFTTKITLP